MNYFLENMGPDMLKQALNKETLLIELFYQLKNGKNIPPIYVTFNANMASCKFVEEASAKYPRLLNVIIIYSNTCFIFCLFCCA